MIFRARDNQFVFDALGIRICCGSKERSKALLSAFTDAGSQQPFGLRLCPW